MRRSVEILSLCENMQLQWQSGALLGIDFLLKMQIHQSCLNDKA
jgi:hypothetical protein